MTEPRKISHYRLIERVGEGGMGVVWKAEDTVLRRTVAVKVLPAEASRNHERRAMFFDEARLASSLSDAHIAQVYEFGQEGNLEFIVMEYVEGKALNKILHGRPMEPDKVAAIGVQVARALSRAHRKGLLHRDLKPSNILMTPDGEVKVVDFGLATLFERKDSTPDPDETTRSSVGVAEAPRPMRAGTLPYMSPEQVRGETLDARSDVFSLGVVLYEMTTGRRPFAGATVAEIAQEIVKARVQPPHELVPKLPLELDRIVQKALAARRQDRFQTMDDLAVDLKRLERELESGSAPSFEDLDRVLARGRHRQIGIVLGAGSATLLVLVAGIAWLVAGRGAKLDEHRVLILPFEVRARTEDADYAGLAFAEALAVNLAQAKELQVLPVQEGKHFVDLKSRLKDAADQEAGILLTGRLVRDQDDVQATVQLLDTTTGRIRWGTEQAAIHGDLAGLASSLSHQALAVLGTGPQKLYDDPLRLTGDPELGKTPLAAEAVGAYHRSDHAAEKALAAKLSETFPRSVEARAIGVFALTDVWYYDQTAESEYALVAAIAALDELDANSPYSAMARAFLLAQGKGKLRESIVLLTSVLSRSDLSPALRAWGLRRRAESESNLGDQLAALTDLQNAIRLDPAAAGNYSTLSRALRYAGRQEEALMRARQAIALEPSYPDPWSAAAIALEQLGRNEESLHYASEACELSRSQTECAEYAIGLQHLRRLPEAKAAAVRAARLTPSIWGFYNLACYHAVAGERHDALVWLRRSVDRGLTFASIKTDPDLESLRGDPEFEKIVAEVDSRLAK
jgi:tetratricopeptide (TPR) repeat protein/predicted Ser/Thr protein kinase